MSNATEQLVNYLRYRLTMRLEVLVHEAIHHDKMGREFDAAKAAGVHAALKELVIILDDYANQI